MVVFYIIVGVLVLIWIGDLVEKRKEDISEEAAKLALSQFDIEDCRQLILNFRHAEYPCSRCSGTMNLRHSQYGPFWGCSNYPECRFTKDLNKK